MHPLQGLYGEGEQWTAAATAAHRRPTGLVESVRAETRLGGHETFVNRQGALFVVEIGVQAQRHAEAFPAIVSQVAEATTFHRRVVVGENKHTFWYPSYRRRN